jgi:hypothetical protein
MTIKADDDVIIHTFKQILYTTYKEQFFTLRFPIALEHKMTNYVIKSFRKRKLIKHDNVYTSIPWVIRVKTN